MYTVNKRFDNLISIHLSTMSRDFKLGMHGEKESLLFCYFPASIEATMQPIATRLQNCTGHLMSNPFWENS